MTSIDPTDHPLIGMSARAGSESSGRVKQRRSRRSVVSLVCLLALIPCAAPDGGSGVRRIEVLCRSVLAAPSMPGRLRAVGVYGRRFGAVVLLGRTT